MFYKTAFSDKRHIPCEFLLTKCKEESFPSTRTKDRGIMKKKKEGVINLLRVTPTINLYFWESLQENGNAEDLMNSNELVEKPGIHSKVKVNYVPTFGFMCDGFVQKL